MHGLRRYLFGVVASLVSSLCFGDWMSFSCTVTVGAAGEGGKPRIRGIVTQVPSAPGFFGHAIDLGSVVAQVAFVRARIFLALMFGGFSFYLRYVRSVVLVSRLRGMSLFRTC